MCEILSRASYLYDSGQYESIIQLLSSYDQNVGFPEDRAMINIWLGKSYFKKEEHVIYYYNSSAIVGRYGVVFPGGISTKHVVKRMSETALTYFDKAISDNPNLDIAYYWKGKVLKYEGRIPEAYECFLQAARLSTNSRKYRKICSTLFSTAQNLPFQETRSLDAENIGDLLRRCYSLNAYSKMEACHAILKRLPPSQDPMRKHIQLVMLSLVEQTIFSYRIPFTGDSDARVRKIARSILLQLSNPNH